MKEIIKELLYISYPPNDEHCKWRPSMFKGVKIDMREILIAKRLSVIYNIEDRDWLESIVREYLDESKKIN